MAGRIGADRLGVAARVDATGRTRWMTAPRPGAFEAVAVHGDGSFWALGGTLAHFAEDGKQDAIANPSAGHPFPVYRALAADVAGQPFLGGAWATMTTTIATATLLRADGSPDPAFNTTGSLSLSPGAPRSMINAVALARDTSPVAAGYAWDAGGSYPDPTVPRVPLVLKLQPDAPPVAALAAPDHASLGVPVTLDARGSSDAEGAIVRYRWDIDGDGSYETDTAATAVATLALPHAGAIRVGLEVTDRRGHRATAAQLISVSAPPVRITVRRASGTVRVRAVGATRFHRLSGRAGFDAGGDIDARRGRVEIVAVFSDATKTRALAARGRLRVRTAGPPLTLSLSGPGSSRCRGSRVLRSLWVEAAGGVRTRGRVASATVSGRWLTADRCDGTLVRVRKGRGTVTQANGRSRPIRAGHSVLVRG